jgi:AcrR family transcriptional regulator
MERLGVGVSPIDTNTSHNYTICMVYNLTRRPSKKQHLFEVAAQLVANGGYAALTIEALAQAAGVTKGGVQYHFASKDELIIELLAFLLGSLNAALEGLDGKAWLKAYVALTLGEPTDGDGAVAAIISALPPGDPRCAPFDHYAKKWREKAAGSGLEPNLAQIIRLAADGQWLERNFAGATAADTAAIRNQLLKMIEDNGS